MSNNQIQVPPSSRGDVTPAVDFTWMDEPPHDEFSTIWHVLERRWRTFLAILVGFVALVMLVSLIWPRSYTATTKLIAGDPGLTDIKPAESNLPVLNALLGNAQGRSPETYVELLQEPPVAQRVIDDLHLNVTPTDLLSHINSKPVTNTSVIQLDVTWPDREGSARIANDFGQVFVNRERDLITAQADSALTFLQSKLPDAIAAQSKAEHDLAEYEAKHESAYAASLTQPGQQSNVAAIDAKIGQLQVDRDQAQATLANINQQLGTTNASVESATSVTQNPVVATLQQQLAAVDVQLKTALKQYTEQHPTVIALRQQEAQLQKEIAAQPESIVSGHTSGVNPTYQALQQQAATLRAQMASDDAQLKSDKGQLNALVKALPSESQELTDLQQRAKMATDVTSALQQRYNDATVAKASSLSDVAVTESADPALAQVHPDLKLNFLLALGLGLVLAFSGVFAIEFFDNTYKDERDVTRDIPLPVLASIPKVPAKADTNDPVHGWLRSLTIDSFLQIVTALRYSSDKPLRTLALVSPLPGDGKSTLCLNLAVALADVSPGVVLVDADMRQPALHESLGVTSDSGLSDALVGAEDVLNVVRPTKYEGLDFLPAGPRVPLPLKLLHSDRFDKVLARLRERYRIVILDTPPLLPVFDGALISTKVDGTVLVVAAGHTDNRSTRRALKRLLALGGSNILGVILNQASTSEKEYAHYRNGSQPLLLKEGAKSS
ncbi:MAG: polysaccharide biosynthesis tyrosine autokinase [Candidatus Eremiobacteraeota bacterium]|nr:polysaccharide biosynthesis tyrosine autokinase [Candidatus Eremiobacteraeota bacterium]MBV8367139.1 polysaccharide biosynthesis tyrosine autokinase [Candidatus Eremiobacteraeota bacterium]